MSPPPRNTVDSGADTRLASRHAYPASTATVALLVITALFVLCQLYSAIPLIAPMSSELDGDVTFALSTAFSLCYAIGFLIWGPLADQCGRKRILLIGLALLTATTFAA